MNGPWLYYFDTGEVSDEGFWVDGKKHGLFKEWYDREHLVLLKEIEYRNGKRISGFDIIGYDLYKKGTWTNYKKYIYENGETKETLTLP